MPLVRQARSREQLQQLRQELGERGVRRLPPCTSAASGFPAVSRAATYPGHCGACDACSACGDVADTENRFLHAVLGDALPLVMLLMSNARCAGPQESPWSLLGEHSAEALDLPELPALVRRDLLGPMELLMALAGQMGRVGEAEAWTAPATPPVLRSRCPSSATFFIPDQFPIPGRPGRPLHIQIGCVSEWRAAGAPLGTGPGHVPARPSHSAGSGPGRAPDLLRRPSTAAAACKNGGRSVGLAWQIH